MCIILCVLFICVGVYICVCVVYVFLCFYEFMFFKLGKKEGCYCYYLLYKVKFFSNIRIYKQLTFFLNN